MNGSWSIEKQIKENLMNIQRIYLYARQSDKHKQSNAPQDWQNLLGILKSQERLIGFEYEAAWLKKALNDGSHLTELNLVACAFSLDAIRVLDTEISDHRVILFLSKSSYYTGLMQGLYMGSESTYQTTVTEPRAKGGKAKADTLYGDEKARFLEAYAEFNTPPYTWRGHQRKSRAGAVRVIDKELNLTVIEDTLKQWAKAFDDEAKAQKQT
ncbi:MAG: hypothetical protein WA154_09890 [Moraxellaceae bacterium]